MASKVILSTSLEEDLAIILSECSHDKTFVLTDTTTHALCWPLLATHHGLRDVIHITIQPSDNHKTLETLSHVWSSLSDNGATRHSCLICLGGGMVTDLGGFAAATFKRGINFINIPTTLLSMVDASVGGKTGINFQGLKNEVGVFADATAVILHTRFLSTLDTANLCSGYAEMLKHGLISDERTWSELISFDILSPDLERLQQMVGQSVAVKERIVEKDPYEQGIRKALNLGHTIGHAIESWSLDKGNPMLHGTAVAYGLICELYLSHVLAGFPTDKLRSTTRFIKECYGQVPITCDDYPTLTELMTHDKKNWSGRINFTLLEDIGKVKINQNATIAMIEEAMDYLREC